MQIHPCLLSVTVALTLAACAPPAADFTESEWPKQLTLDDATTQLDIRFLPGSSRLAAADAARLRVLAANGSIAPADRVLVAAAGSPDLAAARVGAISSELLRYGVVATPLPRGAVAPNRATVEVVRYLVTLPPCPNWSKEPSYDFDNSTHSNFGCANVGNLGRMVASPSDLAAGRPLEPAAGMPAAAAVNRYLSDKVIPPGGAGGIAGGGAGGGSAGGGGGAGGSPGGGAASQ
jgi:pilus assembly protein CpaD